MSWACECCGDRKTIGKFCDFCDKLYFKSEKLRTREKKEEVKVKKEVTPLKERACEECKKDYMPRSHAQKFCSDECRPKPMTEFERWVNKKPRAQNLDSNQVAYGFFRKKYGISNRLKVCRG